jgi:hypothetical protein
MAQHAAQRPKRAQLAIGTGLLAAGVLLVGPAATAFAVPGESTGGGPGTGGSCAGVVAINGRFCNNNSGAATDPGGTTTDPGTDPMSHQPCAKPTPPDEPSDDVDGGQENARDGGGGGSRR